MIYYTYSTYSLWCWWFDINTPEQVVFVTIVLFTLCIHVFTTILTYIYTVCFHFLLFCVKSVGICPNFLKMSGLGAPTESQARQVGYQCHSAALYPWKSLWGIGNSPSVCCLTCFRFPGSPIFTPSLEVERQLRKEVKPLSFLEKLISHQQKLQHECMI